MRRSEMLSGISNVLSALDRSNIADALEALVKREGTVTVDTLGSMREYLVMESSFGPIERELTKTIELDDLANMDWWGQVLTQRADAARPPEHVWRLYHQVGFAQKQLPKILELLKTEAIRRLEAQESEAGPPDDMEVLEVILIEEEGQRSSPRRAITAFEGISQIYEVSALLNKETPESLSLLAWDSGGDKSFDLLGLKAAMDTVKEIFFEIWDRVAFLGVDQMSARMKLIEESLPQLRNLDVMKNEGHIGPEECEIMKRQLLGGIEKILDAGCTIPEIEKRRSYDPRQLMAPSPKLLTGTVEAPDQGEGGPETPTEPSKSKEGGPVIDWENLPPEDVAKLRALLERTPDEEPDERPNGGE